MDGYPVAHCEDQRESNHTDGQPHLFQSAEKLNGR